MNAWIELIKQAKSQGLSKDDVRDFFKNRGAK